MLEAQADVTAIAGQLSPLRAGPALTHSLPLAQLHPEPHRGALLSPQGSSPSHAPSLRVRKMLPKWPSHPEMDPHRSTQRMFDKAVTAAQGKWHNLSNQRCWSSRTSKTRKSLDLKPTLHTQINSNAAQSYMYNRKLKNIQEEKEDSLCHLRQGKEFLDVASKTQSIKE